MNSDQKHLLRMGLLIIVISFLYLSIRLFIPDVDFFIIAIFLLAVLFFIEFSHLIILDPLIRDIAKLDAMQKILKAVENDK